MTAPCTPCFEAKQCQDLARCAQYGTPGHLEALLRQVRREPLFGRTAVGRYVESKKRTSRQTAA